MNLNTKRISKFLSLILRHQPETIGIQLDSEGWAEIETLLKRINQYSTARKIQPLTSEMLDEVVETNDKQRFRISDDGLRIRANQGHSIRKVELALEPSVPPAELFHGTVAKFLESISKHGLIKGSRNHVHLSADLETATKVGSRRGKPVILRVDAAAMHAAEYRFYLSENGVWLVDLIPPKYLEIPQ